MPLPKPKVPTYRLNLPSSGEEIQFRPFLTSEQKILLIAQESDDPQQQADALRQVVGNCVLTEINMDRLASFDLDYLFLMIRAKSVGEVARPKYIITHVDENGKELKEEIELEIDFNKIEIKRHEDHTTRIVLDEESGIGVVMRYPSFDLFNNKVFSALNNEKPSNVQMTFEIMTSCIESVFDNDTFTSADECERSEITEFIDSLTAGQLEKIQHFFETMPSLYLKVEFENPFTKQQDSVELTTMQDFLG